MNMGLPVMIVRDGWHIQQIGGLLSERLIEERREESEWENQ
jgi:hypothetical protein